MKKWITGALAILLGVMSIAVPFSGMHIAEAKTTEETDRKLNIVTTIFPEYDWTRNILGNREVDVNLTMLLDNGTDLHSFQPAVKDIMKVSSCDLLIYVGGESDQWIEDALESAQNKDMKTINLMAIRLRKKKQLRVCRTVNTNMVMRTSMPMRVRMRRNMTSMSGLPCEMLL